jgi:hypothetical protein
VDFRLLDVRCSSARLRSISFAVQQRGQQGGTALLAQQYGDLAGSAVLNSLSTAGRKWAATVRNDADRTGRARRRALPDMTTRASCVLVRRGRRRGAGFRPPASAAPACRCGRNRVNAELGLQPLDLHAEGGLRAPSVTAAFAKWRRRATALKHSSWVSVDAHKRTLSER